MIYQKIELESVSTAYVPGVVALHASSLYVRRFLRATISSSDGHLVDWSSSVSPCVLLQSLFSFPSFYNFATCVGIAAGARNRYRLCRPRNIGLSWFIFFVRHFWSLWLPEWHLCHRSIYESLDCGQAAGNDTIDTAMEIFQRVK